VKQAKQAFKKRSILSLLSPSQKVLLSSWNINLLNTSRKLNPMLVGLFYIKHVNKKWNNYTHQKGRYLASSVSGATGALGGKVTIWKAAIATVGARVAEDRVL